MERHRKGKPGDPYPDRSSVNDYAAHGGGMSEYDAEASWNEYGRGNGANRAPGRSSAVIARDGGDGRPFGPGRLPTRVRDALTHESGQPLTNSERWSSEVGADVSGAKVVTGARAEAAAQDLGARAFTVGDRMFFGRGNYDPGSTGGDRLIRHELTHVAQQQGASMPSLDSLAVSSPSDHIEHEARAHAGGGAGGPSAGGAVIARDGEDPPPINDTEYLRQHARDITDAVTHTMASRGFGSHSEFATWLGPRSMGAAVGSILRGRSDFVAALREVLTAQPLEHLVERGRRHEVIMIAPEGHPEQASPATTSEGPNRWFPDVAVEITNVLTPVVDEAIARIMPRYLAARAQRLARQERERGASSPPGTQPPEAQAGDLIASHPMDHVIIQALLEGSWVNFDVDGYRRANPGVEGARPVGEIRCVCVRPLGMSGGRNWVRVEGVSDPTREEVAQALFGHTDRAHDLTAAGSLFGFSSTHGLVPSIAAEVERVGRDPQACGVDTGALPAGQIADEAALGQATGRASGANREQILERMLANKQLLIGIAGRAQSFGMAARLRPAIQQIEARMTSLAAAPATEAQRWDVHSMRQQEVLRGIDSGIAITVDRLRETARLAQIDLGQDRGAFGLPDHVRHVMYHEATAWVDAALQIDLVDTARELLGDAARLGLTFNVELAEAILRHVQATLDQARPQRRTDWMAGIDHAGVQVPATIQREERLRSRLGELRTQVASDPQGAAAAVQRVLQEVQELELESEMIGNIDALDSAFETLWQVGGSFPAFISGVASDMHELRSECAIYMGTWRRILRHWRLGTTETRNTARTELSQLRANEGFRTFLSRVRSQIQDARIAMAIATIATMLVITLITMGVGEIFAGIAAGAELSTLSGLAMTAGAEAVTMTTLNTAFMESNPTVGRFAAELGLNFATFGLMRGFGTLAWVRGLSRLGQFAAGMTVNALVTGGMTYAQILIEEHSRGRPISDDQRNTYILQGIAQFVMISAGARLAEPFLANLRAEGMAVGVTIRAIEAERVALRQLITVTRGGNVDVALEVLRRERARLDLQRSAFEELLRLGQTDPTALERAGLTRDQISDMSTRLGQTSSDISFTELSLSLEPLGQDHYICPRERVAEVMRVLERQGGQPRALDRDPVTDLQTFEVTFRDRSALRITERRSTVERPGEGASPPSAAEAEAAQRLAQDQARLMEERIQQTVTAVDGMAPPQRHFRRVQVGASIAGTINYGTMAVSAGRRAVPGATVTAETIGDILVIADGPNFIQQFGDFRTGQPLDQHQRLPGFTRRPGETNPSREGLGRWSDINAAMIGSQWEVGMPIYRGRVASVEPRPPGAGADWIAEFKITLENGQVIWADTIDNAGGLGRPRPHPALRDVQARLAEVGRFAFADVSLGLPDLPPGGRVVAIIGGGANGAWAGLAARGHYRVIWISRGAAAGTEVTPELRQFALDHGLHMTDAELLAFRNALVPGATDAFTQGHIQRVVGDVETATAVMPDGSPVPDTGRLPDNTKVRLRVGGRDILVDGVITSIGQELSLPAGMDRLQYRMILRTDADGVERIAGLESVDPPGIRMVGAQYTAFASSVEGAGGGRPIELIIPAERADFQARLRRQAMDQPEGSAGVPPSIWEAGRTVPLANTPASSTGGGTSGGSTH